LEQRQKLIKTLHERHDAIPWKARVEEAFNAVVTRYRQGTPPVRITELPDGEELLYLLYPFCVKDELNLWFGEGGTWKSSFCQWAALLLASGTRHEQSGVMALQPWNVLYADYERSGRVQKARLKKLAAGLGLSALPENFWYLECDQPFVHQVEALQAHHAEHQIDLVIIDSVAGASVGELEGSESATGLMNALRQLRATSLLIDHVRKDPGSGKTSPYGSVTKINRPRNIWEFKLVDRFPGEVIVGLVHRRLSSGEPGNPWGFRVRHEAERITVEKVLENDMPSFDASLTASQRILLELRSGKKTAEQIATNCQGLEEKTIKNSLTNLKKAGQIVNLADHTWALSTRENQAKLADQQDFLV